MKTATLPCGAVVRAPKGRPYTHLIAVLLNDTWSAGTWCLSRAQAEEKLQRMRGAWFDEAMIVEVEKT